MLKSNELPCGSTLVALAKPIRHAIFAAPNMVIVAQLVRAPDCGSGGRGFEPRLSP